MNKKAFTLIELLGVITVLAIISLITIPIVTKTINNSKQSIYDRQVEQIERAAENWFIKQSSSLKGNESIIVDLQTLLNGGYLDKTEIINSKTGNSLSGCVTITYSSNQYIYQFSENNCNCSSDTCSKY